MEKLPDEIICYIFQLVCGSLEEINNLRHLSLVCSRWAKIGRDDVFKRMQKRFQELRSYEIVACHIELLGFELDKIEALHLENCNLSALPDLRVLVNLKTLELGHNNFESPPDLSGLVNLRELNLEANSLTSIPVLNSLENLEELHLACNYLSSTFEMDFKSLKKLQILDLSSNRLAHFPDLMGLNELLHLCFSDNNLRTFPNLNKNPNLEYIDLDNNKIREVPKHHIDGATKLIEIHLNFNRITSFPSVTLCDLNTLSLKGNQLTKTPDLSFFKSLKCLDLSCNKINQIINLQECDQIEYLLMSNNCLTIPPKLSGFEHLQFANLRFNLFKKDLTLEFKKQGATIKY